MKLENLVMHLSGRGTLWSPFVLQRKRNHRSRNFSYIFIQLPQHVSSSTSLATSHRWFFLLSTHLHRDEGIAKYVIKSCWIHWKIRKASRFEWTAIQIIADKILVLRTNSSENSGPAVLDGKHDWKLVRKHLTSFSSEKDRVYFINFCSLQHLSSISFECVHLQWNFQAVRSGKVLIRTNLRNNTSAHVADPLK